MQHQIIQTADGSKTIFIPGMNEQYHSVNGAKTESEYVFIEKGYEFHKSKNPVVFEIGFGTGLNCFLTAILANKNKRVTKYIAIEKYPLEKEILSKLNYEQDIPSSDKLLFSKIHSCEWEKPIQISNYFELIKIKSDLIYENLDFINKFDIIYFDAFGPDKQPEMWSKSIFEKIYNASSDNSIFVTYSAKGEVRRNLNSVGFSMERLPGPPGKKQMLRGIKNKPIL